MRRRILHNPLTRALQYALVACWGLALVAGVQGWSLVGSDWLAQGGSSFWTRCGSAMCGCTSQGWDGPQSAEEAATEVAEAIAEYCWAPGEVTPWSDPEPDPGPGSSPEVGGGWLSIGFVAFGSHRRQHPDGTATPDLTTIPAPDAVGLVDVYSLCGAALDAVLMAPAACAVEAPTPPPKAC